MHKPILRGDKRFWSPIAISSGLAIFFFGISFYTVNAKIGWIDMGFGIALLSVGFATSPMINLIKRMPGAKAQPNVATARPLDEATYKAYLDERRQLRSDLREQSRSFDRYILTLSGGTFGLSLLIIRTLAPQPEVSTIPYLLGAWIAFGASIMLTLISFLLSQKACLHNIDMLEERLEGTGSESRHNIFTKWTGILNWLSMSSFITGVGLLIRFGISNLPVVAGGNT